MPADIYSVFPKDKVLTASDGDAYEESIKRWADNASKRAKYVVQVADAHDASKAILFAIENNLEIAIRGGGHSTSGASSTEGGLVVDLSKLRSVTVDVQNSLLHVGGGALWEDVDKEAIKYGLATVGGTVNHTGVGGLTVGGGYGWLTSKHGLTVDCLRSAEVILANGDIVQTSETENSDLFWAIRGGGSNFGPVTRFTFQGFPQRRNVYAGLLLFSLEQLPQLVGAINKFLDKATEEESMGLFVAHPGFIGKTSLITVVFHNGSVEAGKKVFEDLFAVGPLKDLTHEIPYEELNAIQNPMTTHGDRKLFKGSTLDAITVELISHIVAKYDELLAQFPGSENSAFICEFHSPRKIIQVAKDAMAFAGRGEGKLMNLVVRWTNSDYDKEIYQFATGIVESVNTFRGKKAAGTVSYSNYRGSDERVRDVFDTNYDRLTEIKARYDPNNVFHKWFAIKPKVSN
ncbi:FAD binding domain protein [Trametopsis cervina]|nr:FAD binding domain protein [Trametopsis cervina]